MKGIIECVTNLSMTILEHNLIFSIFHTRIQPYTAVRNIKTEQSNHKDFCRNNAEYTIFCETFVSIKILE